MNLSRPAQAAAALLGLVALVLFGCICGLAAGPLMLPILEASRALTMPAEAEGTDLDPDDLLLAKAAARARRPADDAAEAGDLAAELGDLPPATPPPGGFRGRGDELAWFATKLIQRRAARRIFRPTSTRA